MKYNIVGHSFIGKSTGYYNLDKDKFFNKLTIEQQAKMVADYYKEREQLAPYNVDIFCPDLKKREAILKQTFTHLETPSLCK